MDLSILIPAKNEEFLGVTIKHVLERIEGKTEIIAVIDGYETEVPEIPSDPRLTVIVNHKSLGQRGATNQACRLSRAKYVMKLDAHCAVDQGFDVKMMKDMQDDWTMVPLMKNLHAFDWVCEDGHKRYQGIWRIRRESRAEATVILGGIIDEYSSGGFESKLSFD